MQDTEKVNDKLDQYHRFIARKHLAPQNNENVKHKKYIFVAQLPQLLTDIMLKKKEKVTIHNTPYRVKVVACFITTQKNPGSNPFRCLLSL